jgi:hypothetical protein
MQKRIRASAQDLGEPSDRAAVQEGGGHRRPEPSGAPPHGEANHEAKPPPSQAGRSVRPAPRPRARPGEAAVAPPLRRIPSPDDEDHVDSMGKEKHDGYAVLPRVGPPASEAAARRAEARGTLVRLLVRHVLGRGLDSSPARKAA